MFARTGLTPREAKARLSQRDAADFLYYCSIIPIDDRSNSQMPIAALRSDFLNVNRAANTKAITMDDCLLFKDRTSEDERHIDDDLLNSDW